MSETILYRNWRGETSVRRIKIDAIAYGNEALGLHYCSNEWHPEEQWILFATDIDKCERRGFALSGILAWGEQAVADHATALAEARAEGRRQGLEEAAKNDHSKDFQLMMVRIIQRHRNGRDLTETLEGAADLLKRKGSLSPFRATAPPETQKPETGESAR